VNSEFITYFDGGYGMPFLLLPLLSDKPSFVSMSHIEIGNDVILVWRDFYRLVVGNSKIVGNDKQNVAESVMFKVVGNI
jgi:hypothetical protein